MLPGRSPFARRLDRLLLLLVSGPGGNERRLIAGRGGTSRALRQYRALAGLRRSAWRWRVKLQAVYAQGYQAASGTISSPGEVVHGRELLGEAVQALRAERASAGATVPRREDQVVM